MPFDDYFRNRRVLVTGHTGFKGSWLCAWLNHLGAEVHGIALEPHTEPANFEVLKLSETIDHRIVDVRDLDAVRRTVAEIRPQVIFHLAAQAIVSLSYEQPVETLDTNVMGTSHLLQSVREAGYSGEDPCVVVCITSDKCYENRETYQSYNEADAMGGFDPYSMSKGAAELVIASWRRSYFPPDAVSSHGVSVASVRAGNVIGGGDWALDRIVVDSVKALAAGEPIGVRNPGAIRPWQHVLEPLSGYVQLAAEMAAAEGSRPNLLSPFNFGPGRDSERPVEDLTESLIRNWGSGSWESTQKKRLEGVHEAVYLKLATDKAWHLLRWKPAWDFEDSVRETVTWYRRAYSGGFDTTQMRETTLAQIEAFTAAAARQGLRWATSSPNGTRNR